LWILPAVELVEFSESLWMNFLTAALPMREWEPLGQKARTEVERVEDSAVS
jgi:hypothetical protein